MSVFVYGRSEAEVLFPDVDGAIVRELDDDSETWFPWSDLHNSGSAADPTINLINQEGTK